MLDCDLDKAQLEQWILSLPCRVQLPAGHDTDRVEQSPPMQGDRRRFPRMICRGKRYRAALEYRQSLSALPRPQEWHGVYTLDISRGGIGFLHSEPLYPGERMRVVLLGGAQHFIAIVRCLRLNELCYSIGARFVDEVMPASI